MFNEDFDDYLDMTRSLLGGCESPSDLWEANDCINVALSLRPNHAGAWLLKSQVLSSLEDDFAALAAAEMALRRAPKNAEAHYVRATVLADLERYPEALKSIERAFRHISEDDEWLVEDLFYEKAALFDALDRSDEALATFEAGLLRCPGSALLESGIEPLRREKMRRAFTVIDGGR